jgi:hypothetical protein
LFYTLVLIISLLTWIGARPVENPYILTGQCLTTFYFCWFPLYACSLTTYITLNVLKT